MRAITAVASCIGIGFVLQGCDDQTSTTMTTTTTTTSTGRVRDSCLAEKVDVVSQTMSGTFDVVIEATLCGTTMTTTQTGSFTEMFDFEKFNMREDAAISMDAGELTSVNTTEILNIGEKQLIVYTSAVDPEGKPVKTCVIEQLPTDIPTPEELSIMFNSIAKPFLQVAAVCGGNDGTYDTWKFNETYNGKLPQIPDSPICPGLDNLSVKDGSLSEEVQMTEDALLHASVTHVKGEILNGTAVLGDLVLQASMAVTEVKAAGPSATDLDPFQFDVNCTPVDTVVDIEAFLRSPGFARKALRRIMEASKSEGSLMV